jgi:serine/threonine-protein kinase
MNLLDDRYELIGRVGAGGMSQVYAATDVRLGRKVAVKTLSADVDDRRARDRFELEARSLSSFVHPNAVTIFDAGFDGDRPYLVMELVDGPALSELLRRQGPLPVEDAVRIATQVLAALDAAHRRGLVHRDVKPSNILLGSDGRARLADFGIAKSTGDLTGHLTATGQVVGTASYLAPEVARGVPASPASDLYAAGIVVFEMLTGEVPLRGPTPVATLVERERSAAPPLRSIRPDVPPAVEAAVARALQRDPADRFATADDMRIALTSSDDALTMPQVSRPPAAPGPVPPVPPPRSSRPSRRRHRSRTRLLLAAVLVAAVAGVVAFAAAQDDGTGVAGPDSPSTTIAVPAAGATRTTSPPPTSEPASAPPTTRPVTGTPSTLAQLATELAAPDGRYGTAQTALRVRLLALLASGQHDASKRAGTLARDVARWRATGQLDAAIADDAIRLLGGVPGGSTRPGRPGHAKAGRTGTAED